MRVEHVPGGGGAAYAFLQLDDFLVGLLFHVVSHFLSFSALSSLVAIQYYRFSEIQSATGYEPGLLAYPIAACLHLSSQARFSINLPSSRWLCGVCLLPFVIFHPFHFHLGKMISYYCPKYADDILFLMDTNYNVWKNAIIIHLQAIRAYDHVIGLATPPTPLVNISAAGEPSTIGSSQEVREARDRFHQLEAKAKGGILGSTSPAFRLYLTGLGTSKEM